MSKEKPEVSAVYILRPSRVAQSLFSFEVELFRYEGNFKSGKRESVGKWSLDSGEYKLSELEPGFYALKCRDAEKIFFAKQGERQFLSLELFNTGTFTLPELVIQELDVEKALRLLLEGNRMYSLTETSGSEK
ncbi:hypothetical protein [Leptospira langatensis]|uniref:hypothetical protein n=1 Tax=Leptospira langatensis TaxID=2484983 RepID=UPI001FE68A15|nr:hypothetical protein [Leptospira langatensis]